MAAGWRSSRLLPLFHKCFFSNTADHCNCVSSPLSTLRFLWRRLLEIPEFGISSYLFAVFSTKVVVRSFFRSIKKINASSVTKELGSSAKSDALCMHKAVSRLLIDILGDFGQEEVKMGKFTRTKKCSSVLVNLPVLTSSQTQLSDPRSPSMINLMHTYRRRTGLLTRICGKQNSKK